MLATGGFRRLEESLHISGGWKVLIVAGQRCSGICEFCWDKEGPYTDNPKEFQGFYYPEAAVIEVNEGNKIVKLCRSAKLTHLCSDKLTHRIGPEHVFSFQGVGQEAALQQRAGQITAAAMTKNVTFEPIDGRSTTGSMTLTERSTVAARTSVGE